jgi:parallel beta-helix repeat protein
VLTIRNSTISGNTAGDGNGGGLYLVDATESATIANSTIAGNTAQDSGGGIAVIDSGITLLQTTISANTAVDGVGDGVYLSSGQVADVSAQGDHDVSAQAAGTVTITGTIIAGNADGTDDVATYYLASPTAAAAVTATSDHSVLGKVNHVTITDAGGTQSNIANPGLGALADNGGATRTMALLTGSPAINKGPVPVPTFPGNEFDQRGEGFARVVDGTVDVGAFEVQPAAPAPPPPVVILPAFTG